MVTGKKSVILEQRVVAVLEFVEAGVFQRAWANLECDDDDLRALQIQLINNPDAGPVIPGTGGARKMRFARPSSNQGQSGELRVIYTKFPAFNSLSLLFAYHKSEQEELTDEDKKVIKSLIETISSVLPLRANTAPAAKQQPKNTAKPQQKAKATKKKVTDRKKGKR